MLTYNLIIVSVVGPRCFRCHYDSANEFAPMNDRMDSEQDAGSARVVFGVIWPA